MLSDYTELLLPEDRHLSCLNNPTYRHSATARSFYSTFSDSESGLGQGGITMRAKKQKVYFNHEIMESLEKEDGLVVSNLYNKVNKNKCRFGYIEDGNFKTDYLFYDKYKGVSRLIYLFMEMLLIPVPG